MNKLQLAATALVGAIPAGVLSSLLVMAFLQNGGDLNVMAQALVGLTLLMAAIVTLMPVGCLIFGGSGAVMAAAPSPAVSGKSRAMADSADASVLDDSGLLDDDGEDSHVTFDDDNAGEDDEYGSSAMDEGSDYEMSIDDSSAVMLDEDEDDAPAKKKKKR